MVRSTPTKLALAAVSIAAVAATGTLAPGAVAASAGGGRTAGDQPRPSRVVVPGEPGESARSFTAQSPRVRAIAARSKRSEQANAADRMFVRMMIPHHYQAIVMTRYAPKHAKGRRVRAIAKRIRSEQSVEIASMQGWQGRQGLHVTNAKKSYRRMLKDPDMLEEMGMATRKQMRKLRAAHGKAFDLKLLRLMIPHHKGAIRMAEDVAVDGSDLFIRQTAIDMISSQRRQVHDMRQILKSMQSRH